MRRGAKRGRRKGSRKAIDLPKMPKPLKRRVLEEKPEKPDDVSVEEPVKGDPIVRVRGKTVGAWIEL